jgi:micrococcal nuclease
MGAISGFLASHKAVATVGALAVVGGVAVGGIAVAKQNVAKVATVVKIVDGDTLDVRYGGEEHRIRLLNIDTPETVAPGEPVECLGAEATAFLTNLLPAGTEVRLENDVELYDPYDRELAGVFLGNELVNAEIARAGLGGAVLYEPNDRFYGDVLEAQREAEVARAGLFSPEIECTLPAQVQQYEQLARTAAAAPSQSGSLAEIDGWVEELAAAAAAGAALNEILDGDRLRFPLLTLPDAALVTIKEQVDRSTQTVTTATTQAAEARKAEEERLEAERIAAEAALKAAEEEAARKAAEEEARQEAARLEAAQRAAEEEAARQAAAQGAASQTTPRQPSGSSGGSGGSSGGYDGYTGCRAYGGGYAPNAIDEKGRAYTKIDCSTKQPI